MRISDFANVALDSDGIWRPVATRGAAISYPDSGNTSCFEIEDKSFWFSHRNRVIVWALHQTTSQSNWLLDVGGGNGAVAAFLQNAGHSVCVLEPGNDGAKNSLKRGVSTVINSTLEEAGFKPGSVPAAGLFDVLEHFEDDQSVLRQLRGYLAPGGALTIAVPAYQFLWSDADAEAGHFHRYTKASLARRLKMAGFDVIYSTYFFAPLVLPILLFRSLSGVFRKKSANKSVRTDHGADEGLMTRLMRFFLRAEFYLISKFGSFPFGSSLLIIAQKTKEY